MTDRTRTETVLKDIDIPFARLVVILLKVMLASIPAMILLYAIILIGTLLFVFVFGGGLAALSGLKG